MGDNAGFGVGVVRLLAVDAVMTTPDMAALGMNGYEFGGKDHSIAGIIDMFFVKKSGPAPGEMKVRYTSILACFVSTLTLMVLDVLAASHS
jgi:hypothetical protein